MQRQSSPQGLNIPNNIALRLHHSILYMIPVLILLGIIIAFGQLDIVLGIDAICSMLLFASTSPFTAFFRISIFVVYFWELIQVCSNYFYHTCFDVAFLAVLDPSGLKEAPITFMIIIFVCVVLLIIFVFKSWSFPSFDVPAYIYLAAFLFTSVLLCHVMTLHYYRTFPFDVYEETTIDQFPKIANYFSSPTELVSKGNNKNIILLQVESLENAFFGNTSKLCPGNMQFMWNLSNVGYYNPNAYQQKYLDYSAGALFGAECGLPNGSNWLF